MPLAILNKNNQSYLWALLAHLVLLWLLLAVKIPLPKQHNSVHQAIKSYLYVKQPQTPPVANTTLLASSATKPAKIVNQASKKQDIKTKNTPSPVAKSKEKILNQATKNSADTVSKNNQQPSTTPFSAAQALSNFSKQYQQQQLSKDVKLYTQKRGYSIMDIQPEPVPKFTPKLDWQEKERKATTNYGFNNIVKGENGNCRLDQDLSFARNQATKVSQYFECGRTKLQKQYDAHMDKVLEKLGKKR